MSDGQGTGLGVFGGMFDPVHSGHINAARRALDRLALGRLKLIPCNRPAHRGAAVVTAQHRLAMLQIAIRQHRDMEVDDCEIVRGGFSYAVDTVAKLARSGEFSCIVLVLGMDSFNTLVHWHHWQDLLQLCHFFVLARDDQRVSMEVANRTGQGLRRVTNPQDLFTAKAGRMWLEEDFRTSVSSTAIREALADGECPRAMLEAGVAAYIQQHQLYSRARMTLSTDPKGRGLG